MAAEEYQQQEGNEELWRTVFAVGHPDLLKQHWLHRKLPMRPRCRLCLVPFRGIGGWIMRRRGKAPNNRNPNFCNACDKFLEAFPGGAEIEMSMLYADIRQSTEYADGHEAASVSQRINTFLEQATRAITDHDGFIMAFYGDCVVAAWPPGFSGENHAQKAHAAGRALVGAGGVVSHTGEPIPVGVGLHTGDIYIGTVSALGGSLRDVSIFGSNVNLTARMAARAAASQVLASGEHLAACGLNDGDFASEEAELKGFAEPVRVYSIA